VSTVPANENVIIMMMSANEMAEKFVRHLSITKDVMGVCSLPWAWPIMKVRPVLCSWVKSYQGKMSGNINVTSSLFQPFHIHVTPTSTIGHAVRREDPLGGVSALQVHHGDGSHHTHGGDVTVTVMLAWLCVQHNILIVMCVVRNF
jgi:hypothetical protein